MKVFKIGKEVSYLFFGLTWFSVYKVLWNPVFENLKANKQVQQGCEIKDIILF